MFLGVTDIDIFPCFFAGGHFFNRNSLSPRSLVCEMELPDTQASLDRYDDKSWGSSPWFRPPPPPHPHHTPRDRWPRIFLHTCESLCVCVWWGGGGAAQQPRWQPWLTCETSTMTWYQIFSTSAECTIACQKEEGGYSSSLLPLVRYSVKSFLDTFISTTDSDICF